MLVDVAHWIVRAHPGEPPAPYDLWSSWNLELTLITPLFIAVLIYLWGVRRVWQRAGQGHGIRMSRALCFCGGMFALIVALISPLDALSGALFSAHMAQHLILILIAAPLLGLSDFPLALLWDLPRHWSQVLGFRLNQTPWLSRGWQVLSNPVSAWLLFALALWVWHAPVFYEAALRSEMIHALEHFTFLVTAMLFWWVLFKPSGLRHMHYALAIPYLFTMALHSGILGALMTFTTQPWYRYYTLELGRPWGLTPLQDQQLAGLFMWIPGGIVFTLLTIGYFAAWLNALEQRSVPL